MLRPAGVIRRRAGIGRWATSGAVARRWRLHPGEQPGSRLAADAAGGGAALRWATMNHLGADLERRRGLDWRHGPGWRGQGWRRELAGPVLVLALQVAGTF